MRHALLRELSPIASPAALTLGLMLYLAPGGARALRPPTARAPSPAPASVAWTAPAPRPVTARRVSAPRVAVARPAPEPEATEARPGTADTHAQGELIEGEGIEVFGISGGAWDDGYDGYFNGHRGRWYRRRVTRRGVWRPRPASSWVSASPGEGEGVRSACEVIPALCGELRRPGRRGASAPTPGLTETTSRITLSNEHMTINVDRLARCVVRVRRAEERADTLLTFDVPDALIPCEARVVPDVFHEDGVAVQLSATTPRWTQTITVALGAGEDSPEVTVSRATLDGAAVAREVVNASAQPVTFTAEGRDIAVEPGEVARIGAPSSPRDAREIGR